MNQLIEAIIDKKILGSDTIVTANYLIKDNTGRLINKQDEFNIVNIVRNNNRYNLKLKQIVGDVNVYVDPKDVIALDGMTIERYVNVYDINLDGSTKKVGKKRGRKPKIKI